MVCVASRELCDRDSMFTRVARRGRRRTMPTGCMSRCRIRISQKKTPWPRWVRAPSLALDWMGRVRGLPAFPKTSSHHEDQRYDEACLKSESATGVCCEDQEVVAIAASGSVSVDFQVIGPGAEDSSDHLIVVRGRPDGNRRRVREGIRRGVASPCRSGPPYRDQESGSAFALRRPESLEAD